MDAGLDQLLHPSDHRVRITGFGLFSSSDRQKRPTVAGNQFDGASILDDGAFGQGHGGR